MKNFIMINLMHNMLSHCSRRTIVITGGAGYIGSIVAHYLTQAGYAVVIIDIMHIPQALCHNINIFYFQGDYADVELWQKITTQFSCDFLIHLAAFIEVGESVLKPAAYYENNVAKFIRMLEIVRQAGITGIIAASSSAVYGNPCAVPIPEHHQRAALSPYGRTKMMLEDVLIDYHYAYGIKVAMLRFANVAGSLPEYGLGECHNPETHLIPRIISAIQQRQNFVLHGNDYPTPDGTCLRDFVHVYDVARLHGMLLDMFYIGNNEKPIVLNVGSGAGSSVRKVIATVESVMCNKVLIEEKQRRAGDTPTIILDISEAYQLVGWQPIASDLTNIVASACQFHAMVHKELFVQRDLSLL